jgi:hypothetical protein
MTTLSGMTVYFGYQELGIARAIFLATGVMAFGMSIVFFWARISQMLSTFQRLSMLGVAVPGASIDAPKGKVTGINLQCILRNDSQMMMFYRLKRVHHTFERIGPKDTGVDQNVVVALTPGNPAPINFATIEDVPFPDKKVKRISGNFDLEVEYGPAIDDLKFELQYKSDLSVVFNPIPNSKEFRIDLGASMKLFKHSRV